MQVSIQEVTEQLDVREETKLGAIKKSVPEHCLAL